MPQIKDRQERLAESKRKRKKAGRLFQDLEASAFGALPSEGSQGPAMQ
jgi:hypothetical protein